MIKNNFASQGNRNNSKAFKLDTQEIKNSLKSIKNEPIQDLSFFFSLCDSSNSSDKRKRELISKQFTEISISNDVNSKTRLENDEDLALVTDYLEAAFDGFLEPLIGKFGKIGDALNLYATVDETFGFKNDIIEVVYSISIPQTANSIQNPESCGLYLFHQDSRYYELLELMRNFVRFEVQIVNYKISKVALRFRFALTNSKQSIASLYQDSTQEEKTAPLPQTIIHTEQSALQAYWIMAFNAVEKEIKTFNQHTVSFDMAIYEEETELSPGLYSIRHQRENVQVRRRVNGF